MIDRRECIKGDNHQALAELLFPLNAAIDKNTLSPPLLTMSFSFQETSTIAQRNNNLTEYYQSLRDNMISLLEHVRIPNAPGGPQEKIGHENFDSYLTKLQTLCTADSYCTDDSNRPIYETVKTALQDFTVLPTPI